MQTAVNLEWLVGARRILVLGPCGAGKTTLAAAVAARLGHPHIRLDELYWLAGWKRPNPEDWRAGVRRAAAEPCWVMDGNHQDTLELRLPCADLVLHLDLPAATCLRRVLVRDLKRALGDRSDLPPQLRFAGGSGEHLAFWLHVVAFNREVRPLTLREPPLAYVPEAPTSLGS